MIMEVNNFCLASPLLCASFLQLLASLVMALSLCVGLIIGFKLWSDKK